MWGQRQRANHTTLWWNGTTCSLSATPTLRNNTSISTTMHLNSLYRRTCKTCQPPGIMILVLNEFQTVHCYNVYTQMSALCSHLISVIYEDSLFARLFPTNKYVLNMFYEMQLYRKCQYKPVNITVYLNPCAHLIYLF